MGLKELVINFEHKWTLSPVVFVRMEGATAALGHAIESHFSAPKFLYFTFFCLNQNTFHTGKVFQKALILFLFVSGNPTSPHTKLHWRAAQQPTNSDRTVPPLPCLVSPLHSSAIVLFCFNFLYYIFINMFVDLFIVLKHMCVEIYDALFIFHC